MGFMDDILKISVASVLRGDGIDKIKEFEFDGYKFVPSHLAHMGVEIMHDQGFLKIRCRPNAPRSYYEADINSLTFNFVGIDYDERKGVIVHEATHALFDFKLWNKMEIGTSEAIAYLAQCQYMRANFGSDDPENRLRGKSGKRDEVFEVGWRLAGKLLGGSGLDATDVADMKTAVANHPYYCNDHTDLVDYDGMS